VDQRLSDVDMDEKKSMNTHLHLLEAYATLLRFHEDPTVRLRLRELIEIFLDHIIDPANHHFILFFDEEWLRAPKSPLATTLREAGCCARLRRFSATRTAEARARGRGEDGAGRLRQGLDTDGGLLYEADPTGIIDTDKHWWPQAEAVVGFLNAYELSGQPHFLMPRNEAGRSSTSTSSITSMANGSGWCRKSGVPSDEGQSGPVEVPLPQQPHLL
jgi:cellobiose epimerase